MALPKNVQRQLDAAEALQAQAAQAPGVEVVSDPSQLPAPVAAAPAPEAPPAPAPEPPPPAPAPASTENWENRYRSLKGRVDTEMPALQAREKVLTAQVERLTEQVLALTKAATAAPEKPAVDPRDAQQFGEDMVEMVQRNARHAYETIKSELTSIAGKLESRVAALEERVVGVAKKTEQTLEDTFYSSLESQVPDWKAINASQQWLQWLGEIDPVYGLPRQAALDVAFQRQDSARVVNIFKQFKAATAKKPAPSLESQVAPATGSGGQPSTATPAPKPMLNQKFVNTFYTDVAKGRYVGREAEQQRIENEINLAAREGRIV